MGKILKYAGAFLGIIVVVLLVILFGVYLITESHWNAVYELNHETVEMSTDPDVITYGKHVFTIRGCVDCHGENLAGRIFLEDPVVGRIVATNLTSGQGGIGSRYSDSDLIRSIRKGVKSDGRPVLFMPSYEYNLINEKDLSAMLSYIRSAEPVDNVLPENKLALPIRAIYLTDKEFALFPARVIDHSVPIPIDEPQTILERGSYLATSCIGCHGTTFSGGKIPGVPPDWPAASNLTPGGNLATWTEDDFFRTLKEGITPDGRQLRNEYMPYSVISNMTDEEILSIFAYLQSLPPMESGNR